MVERFTEKKSNRVKRSSSVLSQLKLRSFRILWSPTKRDGDGDGGGRGRYRRLQAVTDGYCDGDGGMVVLCERRREGKVAVARTHARTHPPCLTPVASLGRAKAVTYSLLSDELLMYHVISRFLMAPLGRATERSGNDPPPADSRRGGCDVGQLLSCRASATPSKGFGRSDFAPVPRHPIDSVVPTSVERARTNHGTENDMGRRRMMVVTSCDAVERARNDTREGCERWGGGGG